MATSRAGTGRAGASGERLLAQAILRLGKAKPEGERTNRYGKLAAALWDMALDGEHKQQLAAIRLILDYGEGKPAPRPAAEAGREALPAFTADEAARAQESVVGWPHGVKDQAGAPGGSSGGLGTIPVGPGVTGQSEAEETQSGGAG